MIPGTLCNEVLFQNQYDYFCKKYDVHIADSSTHNDLKEQSNQIVNSISGDFILMGLSYGAIIAFEIMRQTPERVEKLIILNSTHKKPQEQTRQNFKKFLDMASNGRFPQIMPDFLLPLMLYPPQLKNEKLCDEVIRMANSVGVMGFENQVNSQLDRIDSTKTLEEITCPTLIIAGEHDKLCPVELHREMHGFIPSSKLEIIKECGHLSTMECPDRVNKVIGNWI